MVDPLSYFSFQPVLHDWYNKGRSMCYPDCWKGHTKRTFDAPSGAGRSSEVERSLMVRWVVGSILHRVDPLSYFSFQPVLHDWCNKGRGICYPVCGIVHIKEPCC